MKTSKALLNLLGHIARVMSIHVEDDYIVYLDEDNRITARDASIGKIIQNLKGYGNYDFDYAISIKCSEEDMYIA